MVRWVLVLCMAALRQCSGSAASSAPAAPPRLTLLQEGIAGGLARCAAQTTVHPFNVAKTVLQTKGGADALRLAFRDFPFGSASRAMLSRGILAQAVLSLPNGAINFCTMEAARRSLDALGAEKAMPTQLVDLFSACAGTALATVVSLPQSVLNDRIMSGAYRNLPDALRRVGLRGLYPASTWRAALVAKVPAYSLTWCTYKQLRRWRLETKGSAMTAVDDISISALASSLSVCVFIPLDTIKVRMTTGTLVGGVAYGGVLDALRGVCRDEGLGALYRGLPPRLLSVVPMTAIQFAAYELCRRNMPTIQARTSELIDAAKARPARIAQAAALRLPSSPLPQLKRQLSR